MIFDMPLTNWSRLSNWSVMSRPENVPPMIDLLRPSNCASMLLRSLTLRAMDVSAASRTDCTICAPLFSAVPSWRADATAASAELRFEGATDNCCSELRSVPIKAAGELLASGSPTVRLSVSRLLAIVDCAACCEVVCNTCWYSALSAMRCTEPRLTLPSARNTVDDVFRDAPSTPALEMLRDTSDESSPELTKLARANPRLVNRDIGSSHP